MWYNTDQSGGPDQPFTTIQEDNGYNPSVAFDYFSDPYSVIEVHNTGDGLGPEWYHVEMGQPRLFTHTQWWHPHPKTIPWSACRFSCLEGKATRITFGLVDRSGRSRVSGWSITPTQVNPTKRVYAAEQ